MTKAELIKIVESDPYHKDRQNLNDTEIRLYLREVNYHCPLCGKELQYRGQKKQDQKLFQIAHIYPNSPTLEQYTNFNGLRRLGNDCESFENKIALCLECHPTQDFHTTAQEYTQLLEIKERLYRASEASARLDNEMSSIKAMMDELEQLGVGNTVIDDSLEDEVTVNNFKRW